MNRKPKQYKSADVAKRLDVCEQTVRNYIRAGLLTAVRGDNGAWQIPEDELKRALRDGIDTSGMYRKIKTATRRKPKGRGEAAPAKKASRAAAPTPAGRKAAKKKTSKK